jgi:molybdopterin molybdotransferase
LDYRFQMQRTFSPASSRQAFEWADGWTCQLNIKALPLTQATGYRLAQTLVSDTDIPMHTLCSRDGYAVRAADSLGAGDYNPLPLRLLTADQSINPGYAALVSSGDVLPAGADAVLSPEQIETRVGFIDVASSLAPGDGVIQPGEECSQNSLLLDLGRRLRAQDLAWLTQAGIDTVSVYAKPRVSIYTAGRFTQDANNPMLSALLQRDAAELISSKRVYAVKDLAESLCVDDADVIVVVGATGYGETDYAVQALQECGQVQLDGVTIHPGGGVVLGKVADKPVLLLPGSPLGCLCAYDLIAARLIRRLAGLSEPLPYRRIELTLARKLVSRIGQLELARMRINADAAEPLAVVDDRLLASSVQADGFVLLPENSEGYAEGSPVTVYLYD